MSTPTDEALVADAIHKAYGRVKAVRDVGLHVERGSIHGLLGPNGSGKSTMLHILAGLIAADRGEVLICGESITRKQSRAHLGFVPDDLPLPAALTGREYLEFHDGMRNRDDRLAARQLAGVLAMTDALNLQVGGYSHGMKRKIQLIAALSHRPRLLILDEPFRGLDPDAGATLRDILVTFVSTGGAVLVATHDMLRAERDCDSVTILHRGRRVEHGSPATLLTKLGASSLEEVFLRVTSLDRERRHCRDKVSAFFAPTPMASH